jgi:hypothetical protein
MGLSFTIIDGPRQRSHSQVQVPRESWTYFSVLVSRLLQPGGPGPRIYIPQEEGGHGNLCLPLRCLANGHFHHSIINPCICS